MNELAVWIFRDIGWGEIRLGDKKWEENLDTPKYKNSPSELMNNSGVAEGVREYNKKGE